jgi:hypothetical protein
MQCLPCFLQDKGTSKVDFNSLTIELSCAVSFKGSIQTLKPNKSKEKERKSGTSITVNALWCGTDGLSSGKSTQRFHSDGFHYVSHYTGTSRGADAAATITGDINMILDNPYCCNKLRRGFASFPMH